MGIITRISLIIILTILFYVIFHNKKQYIDKPTTYYYKKFIFTFFIVLIPPMLYFLIPDSVGIVFKFYFLFILSALILLGLILFPIWEKRKREGGGR